jgi:hypothetical protein
VGARIDAQALRPDKGKTHRRTDLKAGEGMKTTAELFDNNRHWAKRMTQINRRFFKDLVRQQTPKYLWIGCADSRVPANEIVGLSADLLVLRPRLAVPEKLAWGFPRSRV